MQWSHMSDQLFDSGPAPAHCLEQPHPMPPQAPKKNLSCEALPTAWNEKKRRRHTWLARAWARTPQPSCTSHPSPKGLLPIPYRKPVDIFASWCYMFFFLGYHFHFHSAGPRPADIELLISQVFDVASKTCLLPCLPAQSCAFWT